MLHPHDAVSDRLTASSTPNPWPRHAIAAQTPTSTHMSSLSHGRIAGVRTRQSQPALRLATPHETRKHSEHYRAQLSPRARRLRAAKAPLPPLTSYLINPPADLSGDRVLGLVAPVEVREKLNVVFVGYVRWAAEQASRRIFSEVYARVGVLCVGGRLERLDLAALHMSDYHHRFVERCTLYAVR
ncbi:hypothetical protein BJX96DRAFT_11478 [Aspergillus floccosus]